MFTFTLFQHKIASDLSSGVTGEVHHVDSGYNILGMYMPEDA